MEQLKGFRTLIMLYGTMFLSILDTVRETVQSILEVVGTQVGEGGAVAALVVAGVTIKQIITDVIPRLQGTLGK